MPSPIAELFLLEDLADADRTKALVENDRDALRGVADWIATFAARPHQDLGRAGPVCPFVPLAREHKTLRLAVERSAGRSAAEIVRSIDAYRQLLVAARPAAGGDTNDNAIVVVFSDLAAARAKDFFAGLLGEIGISSYVNDGLVMGPFYPGNDAGAIYNPNFRPFAPPVPFLLIRHAVVSDWKFFLNNEDWFRLWARRHGEAAAHALAEELRQLPWRTRGASGSAAPSIDP